MTERTLGREDKEFKNLKRVADILTTMSDDEEIQYVVRDCYFDYGQNWMWTTILRFNYRVTGILRSCQVLSPKQWKDIVALDTKEGILDYVKNNLLK